MKKAIIVAVVAFTGSNVCAQDTEPTGETSTERKNQISLNVAPVIGSAAMDGKFKGRSYLQYRRKIKDRLFWRVDASYRRVSYSNLNTLTPNANNVISQTDSTRKFRAYGNNYNYFTTRVGMDRIIGDREIYSVGFSVINGVTKHNDDYSEIDQEIYEGSGTPEEVTLWMNICDPYNVDPNDSCETKLSDIYYYSVGASVNFNLNLPLTDRWSFTLLYEPQVIYHIKVAEETQSDFAEVALYQNAHPNFAEFRGNVDLLLRYRF